MVDYIKIRIRLSSPESFVSDSGLPFIEGTRTDTAEVIDFWTAELECFQLQVYKSGTFIVKGSVHKYRNNGDHNYDDFSLEDYSRVVRELSEIIGLNLWEFTLDTLEVGVNIDPIVPTKEFLGHTFRHKSKAFKDVSLGPKGNYRQAAYSDFFVKIYDKGLQYDQGPNLMRFEVKLKADELRKLNINQLMDTVKIDQVKVLKEYLLKRFEEVVFIDPSISKEELTVKQQDRLLEWHNPRFWETLKSNPSSKNSYANEIKKLQKIVSSYSDQFQDQVKHAIEEKLGVLAPVIDEEKRKTGKNGSGNKSGVHSRVGKSDSSYIPPSIPHSRTCVVTHLDISMQKEDSRFLYATGVEYYRENHPDIYKELEKRISSTWDQATIEKRNLEIAHSIRNEYFNELNQLKKKLKYTKGQYALFSDQSLLTPRLFSFRELREEFTA